MYLEALCEDFIENYDEDNRATVAGRPTIAKTKQRLIDAVNFQSEIHTYGCSL